MKNRTIQWILIGGMVVNVTIAAAFSLGAEPDILRSNHHILWALLVGMPVFTLDWTDKEEG